MDFLHPTHTAQAGRHKRTKIGLIPLVHRIEHDHFTAAKHCFRVSLSLMA